MFSSYGFILYILYIPGQKSLRHYGYWWSEGDNLKRKNTEQIATLRVFCWLMTTASG